MHNEDLKQSRDLAPPLIGVGIKRISCRRRSRGASATTGRRRRPRSRGGDACSSELVSVFMVDYCVMIPLRQKVGDSRTENSRDVLFVAVAVYLWSDKRYVACLLTKSACSFPYMRTCLNVCLLAKCGSFLMMCPILALISG